MALLYFVAIIIHYIQHKSKYFHPHFFKTSNQSLTNFMKTDFIKIDVAATSQIDIAANNMSSSVKTTPINVPNGYKFSHVVRLYSNNSNIYVSMNSVSNNGSTVSLYLCGRNLSTTQQKGSLYGVVCFIKK